MDSSKDDGASSSETIQRVGFRTLPGYSGCKHYRRWCQIVAPCCNEVFWCRHCHNEAKHAEESDSEKCHELDRKAIQQIICAKCGEHQTPSECCSKCGICFAKYFCSSCNFWDDEGISKNVFHCEHCGICRVGGRDRYFHCHICGSCYPNEIKFKHTCVQNAMHQNCPICQENLFQSVRQVTILRCGHTIHQDCLIQLRGSCTGMQSLRCPCCMVSFERSEDLAQVWEQIDVEVENTPMPTEYENLLCSIICNDCHEVARVPFHVLALKCPHCQSYNTRREGLMRQNGDQLEHIETIDDPTVPDDEPHEEA